MTPATQGFRASLRSALSPWAALPRTSGARGAVMRGIAISGAATAKKARMAALAAEARVT